MDQFKYDVFHMGRSGLDLYSNDIGAAFVDIKSFAAYVGGSPTNMSVGGARLGLHTVLLTALGEDLVGDFVVNFLNQEGVETAYCPRKPDRRTSCVVLGIEPPDRFPLVFYRDNCADISLDLDDVLAAPLRESRVFQFAGTNLSKDPSRTATLYAAESAKQEGVTVVMDLDFRPDQWSDPRHFGIILRSVMSNVDIIIGSEDEINAVMLTDPGQVRLTHSQVSDARVLGETKPNIEKLLDLGPEMVVEKRGGKGCLIHRRQGEEIEAPGFKVEIQNILGAGDAFGAGFLYGYVKGWSLYQAARLGNACGAVVVSRHGCSVSMPTYDEAMEFAQAQGGL